MKKIILFLTIILTTIGYSQNAQDIIDGLKNDLKNNPDAKKIATIYSDLTWYYSNVSLDSAMSYGKKAIVESTKLRDSTLIAQVYSDLGAVYFRKGDIEESKRSYLKAYSIREIRKDYNGLAKININLANIYQKKQQNDLAMKSYLAAVDYFEKNNNPMIVSSTKANIGIVFHDMHNYRKAIPYLKEAISYQEKNNLIDGLCTSYLSIGNSYLKLTDTLKSLFYYNKSLKACKACGNKLAIQSVLNNIGSVKLDQKKGNEAVNAYVNSKKIRTQLDDKNENPSLLLNQAKENIMFSKFNEAKVILLRLKPIFIKKKLDEDLLVTYQYFIHTSAYLNQPDSVNFYTNKAFSLQSTIIEKSVVKQTNELETKYQTEKKEKLLLQKEAEAKQKNFLLLGISAIAFFVTLIAFLIYRQQKLKNQQQEQEFQLKTAISKIETQSKLQEQRLTISRDLHDNIGSQLTFIISSVDNVKYAFDIQNEKLDSKLTNISSFAKDTIVELRDTIWAMNNESISFEDLRMRMLNFIEKAQNSQENIDFNIDMDSTLNQYKWSSVAGMNIYRTIQEAINNALKYSKASLISIAVKEQVDQIQISIHDNGIGFDMENTSYGNGIANMKKRIEDNEGVFSIMAAQNQGTTITIQLKKEDNII